MVKITGYYQLPGRLPQAVDFSELFDRSFMRRFTHCRSFERFLAGGRFRVRSQAEFEALPEEEMDAYVRRATRFSSWKEMLDTATDLYARRQLLRE
ncbi:hypothetical protein [Selenomonas bovis]|uniref:hypothetical protein n=1 Tax=Selenomonas bovis TaxID=416586 RepID=UPI003AB9AE27